MENINEEFEKLQAKIDKLEKENMKLRGSMIFLNKMMLNYRKSITGRKSVDDLMEVQKYTLKRLQELYPQYNFQDGYELGDFLIDENAN